MKKRLVFHNDWISWWICARGILLREALRHIQQNRQFFAALARPLVWLFIFAAGFRALLGPSITPPYETYVQYEVYVVPGLCGMIQLFNGIQSSRAMVYDRETGAMQCLLVSPFPRWFLLVCKLLAMVLVSLLQVYTFLWIARIWGVDPPWLGYLAAAPALVLSGLLLGAFGLFISSVVKQLEDFAGVVNFVVLPMFFASSALYPLWRVREGSEALYRIGMVNPFTHCVELIRYALYLQVNWLALGVVGATGAVFLGAALWVYSPARGLMRGR